jgi:hypothetical protein
MNPRPTAPCVDSLQDFLSGRPIPNRGAEANRQAVLRHLVEVKGYAPDGLRADVPLQSLIDGQPYVSKIDVLVIEATRGIWALAIKCVAGSLGSWEREALAAARILRPDYQIPLSAVSDGKDAVVLDTTTGRKVGFGLEAIPSRRDLERLLGGITLKPYPPERLEREKLIFRTYDVMNVNRRPS